MDKKKIETYFESIAVRNIYKNRIFRIVFLPIVIFTVGITKFHGITVRYINRIEKLLNKEDVGCSTNTVLYVVVFSSLSNYVLTFISEVIFGFYIQNAVVNTFKAHAYEYIMINHTDFHSLGAGEIRAIIERRTKAVCYTLIRSINQSFIPICSLINMYYTVYKIWDKVLIIFNLVVFLVYLFIIVIAAIVVTLCKINFNISYNVCSNSLYEFLTNYEVVKIYNKEEYELERIYILFENVRHNYFLYEQSEHFFKTLISLTIALPNVVLLYFSISNRSYEIFKGETDFRDYERRFNLIRGKLNTIADNFIRVTEFFTDITHTCIDNVQKDNDFTGEPIKNEKEEIRFKNVSYSIGDHLIFEDVNFKIRKGEKIALVGKNGSGKSTLFGLLLKFKKYSGDIYFGNKNYNDISITSLRDKIAFIPQYCNILDLSVLDNLKYSNDRISNEEIRKKCIIFDTHTIFSNLKDGYLTRVGDNSKNLSGGQKQQINFMRGVLKECNIMLLDEPTANLDHKAEDILFHHVFTTLKQKTILTIIHSPRFLPEFDRIFGFRDNKIIIYNSYKEYLAEEHLY